MMMLNLWRNRDLRAKIAGIVAGCIIVSYATFFTLLLIWEKSAPTEPNELSGNVLIHSDHGAISYFTAFQATSCALLFWFGFVGTGLAILTMPKRDKVVTKLGGIPLGVRWQSDDEQGVMRNWTMRGGLIAAPCIWFLGPLLVGWLNQNGVVLNI